MQSWCERESDPTKQKQRKKGMFGIFIFNLKIFFLCQCKHTNINILYDCRLSTVDCDCRSNKKRISLSRKSIKSPINAIGEQMEFNKVVLRFVCASSFHSFVGYFGVFPFLFFSFFPCQHFVLLSFNRHFVTKPIKRFDLSRK